MYIVQGETYHWVQCCRVDPHSGWWGDAAAHPIYTLAIICPLVTPTHQTPFNVTIARVRHCYCPLLEANFILITLPQFE